VDLVLDVVLLVLEVGRGRRARSDADQHAAGDQGGYHAARGSAGEVACHRSAFGFENRADRRYRTWLRL
jgi:hypothetical protein